MTKTKGVRQLAGVAGADLQVLAQRCWLRDSSRHRKSYSRSSVASGSLVSARRLASMLLIQLFFRLELWPAQRGRRFESCRAYHA
jgi:hypothetical protein